MQDYLEEVFGDAVVVSAYSYPDHTPMYMKDGYKAETLEWNNNKCVLLSPQSPSWRLPTLKTQLKKFQELCKYPCALYLDRLTALQRRNLLENNIPFVSESQQVYLPFWGASFFERFKESNEVPDTMAPGTQLVFLYLYYLQNTDNINLTQIAGDLNLSKATCNRAITDLCDSGLITLQAEGRKNRITLTYAKPEYLRKGYARLKSPVDRIVFVSSPLKCPNFIKSGLLALSDISMVGAKEQDGGMAIFKKNALDIPQETIISKQEFEDFGGYIIEAWSYDPALLSDGNRVDDISLLLCLDDNQNERVQMGLDEIREKYGLPIKEEE